MCVNEWSFVSLVHPAYRTTEIGSLRLWVIVFSYLGVFSFAFYFLLTYPTFRLFPLPLLFFFLPFIFLSFSFNLLLFFVFPSLHSFLEICYDRLKITMSSLKSVQFVITISFTIIINITINIIIIRTRGPATSELSTPVRPHAFSHARTHSSSFSLSLSRTLISSYITSFYLTRTRLLSRLVSFLRRGSQPLLTETKRKKENNRKRETVTRTLPLLHFFSHSSIHSFIHPSFYPVAHRKRKNSEFV